jgi:hypothetical protein
VATGGEQAMGGTRRTKKNKRRRSRSSDKRGDGGWGSKKIAGSQPKLEDDPSLTTNVDCTLPRSRDGRSHRKLLHPIFVIDNPLT